MTTTIEEVTARLWPAAEIGPAWRLRTAAVEIQVSALGAHLSAVRMRSGDGWQAISVDYPPVGAPGGFHGATVGRWANRIAGAEYTFAGTRHRLTANEGPNILHGGPRGFDTQAWRLLDRGDAAVRLGLHSPDGDQGFPGAVEVSARFELVDDRLTIAYSVEATEPTPLNITSHPYWNLGGEGTLDDHRLRIVADAVIAVDTDGIPLPGPPLPVVDTPFDCRCGRDLDAVVADGGFDHCFVLGDPKPGAPQVELAHSSGRRLLLTTDQPGVQVYTGQHLDPRARGVALETQRFPDGPNRPDFGPAITTSFASTTTIRFCDG